MRELYQHEGMIFEEEVARSGLNKTLVDATMGSVYLILVNQELAGYLALTFCFSLEFYGKMRPAGRVVRSRNFSRTQTG
jgi:hypothetical protein